MWAIFADLPPRCQGFLHAFPVFDQGLHYLAHVGLLPLPLGISQHVHQHPLPATKVGVEFAQSNPQPPLRVGDLLPRPRIGRGILGQAERSASLSQGELVGEVAVDGRPAHPCPLGYGAYGGLRGPEDLVQLEGRPGDPQPRLLLALGSPLQVVLTSLHDPILSEFRRTARFLLTTTHTAGIMSSIILHYRKVIAEIEGEEEGPCPKKANPRSTVLREETTKG